MGTAVSFTVPGTYFVKSDTDMAENTPSFTVTDRRKFTLDGELRDDYAATNHDAEREQTTAAPVSNASKAAEFPSSSPQVAASEPTAAATPADSDESTEPELAAAEDDFEGEMPELTAQETAEQHAAYRQSAKDLDDMVAKANPGVNRPPASEMNFDKLVQSIYMTAALQLGAGTQPGEQPRVDILGARQSIDMLNVLSEKTKGNLTDKEQRLLQNALFELRMTFLEITNAISSSAHATPRPAGGIR